ncbi:MAG: hypothetical protein IH588_02070 [Anaerolineales bacterium]|nr:hypothetical protein [Anaerolineales bacterium]
MNTFQDEIGFVMEDFGFLFTEFDYKITYRKEFRRDHYCIGLTSNSCGLRIKFERELAPRWGVFIGTSLEFDGPLGNWIPVEKALNSLDVHVDYSELREKKYYEQVHGSLKILAKTIRPIFGKLLHAPLP